MRFLRFQCFVFVTETSQLQFIQRQFILHIKDNVNKSICVQMS